MIILAQPQGEYGEYDVDEEKKRKNEKKIGRFFVILTNSTIALISNLVRLSVQIYFCPSFLYNLYTK